MGRHVKPKPFPWARLALLGSVAAFNIGLFASPPPAHAATAQYFGARVLDKAETRAGDWYVYGGAGPYVFDCSGLVYWSARQLGVPVPRSTYALLADSGRFYRIPVSAARRGDLMFYGPGHVEIMTAWGGWTFGAQTWGTRVGWHHWGGWWQPTMALRWR